MPNKPVFVERVILRAFIAALGLIGLWFAAHWLKNLYLGNLVSYQEHFNSTVKVNLLLIIFTIGTVRFIWKELAFTLVELAIVLIIIGFIIAGITSGISMTKSARYNTIIIEVNTMQTAAMNFRSRFNALPGDYGQAFSVWGSACGTNDVGAANSCNGNNNGRMDNGVGASGPVEDVKFWYHLSAAQMLPNSLTGQIVTANSVRQVAGQNVPTSQYSKNIAYFPSYFNFYDLPLANMMTLGTYFGGQGLYNDGAFTALDAYAVDSKMDDGNPSRGKVIVGRGSSYLWSSYCVSGNINSTTPVTYLFSDTVASCRLVFYNIDAG